MNENEEKIYKAFGGKLVGNQFIKLMIVKALNKLPKKIVEFVTDNCWFMSSMEDAYGFTFTGNDLKDKHLIFLSDDLFAQSTHQIQHTIIHEIGHVILNHKNSTFLKQTKLEIEQQEKEAEEFVAKYLK